MKYALKYAFESYFGKYGYGENTSKFNYMMELYTKYGLSHETCIECPSYHMETHQKCPITLHGFRYPVVASDGNTYDAIGWLHKKTSDRLMHIKVDDRNGVDSIGAVPMLSSAGKDSLVLLFRVPKGRDVKAIRLGDTPIAPTNPKTN